MKYGKRKQKYLEIIEGSLIRKAILSLTDRYTTDYWITLWRECQEVYPAPEGGVPWNPENIQ